MVGSGEGRMRTLSSSATWWIKYFFPSIFAVGMVGLGLWARQYDAPVLSNFTDVWQLGLLYCVVAALCTFLVAWRGLSLKQVRMDDDALYISNFFREIRVPLSNMEHVSEFVGARQGKLVTRAHIRQRE